MTDIRHNRTNHSPVTVTKLCHYSAESYMLQPSILFYFTGQFGGVHAFGYDSAESEPIWIRYGAF